MSRQVDRLADHLRSRQHPVHQVAACTAFVELEHGNVIVRKLVQNGHRRRIGVCVTTEHHHYTRPGQLTHRVTIGHQQRNTADRRILS